MNATQQLQILSRALSTAHDRWQGCDWDTAYGDFRLDLNGLRAQQTRLLAEATSGEEAHCWESATRWLEGVERDAKAAEAAAAEAVRLVENQEWEKALASIQKAFALEAKYRTPVIWNRLLSLISEIHRKSLASRDHT